MLKSSIGTTRHSVRVLLILFIVSALIGCAGSPSAQNYRPKTSVQNSSLAILTSGPVVGFERDGIHQFLGIPYAAPPLGSLRWRSPQPVKAWSEIFQATHYGSSCAQVEDLGHFAGASASEDCLFLNVFAPVNSVPSEKRPVMVWIYGGGLFAGESDSYDPSRIVVEGNVIVVTFNYRLGTLGFLAHPSLYESGKTFVNFGFQDQQMVLGWVKENIGAFGGNPENVTIFGESAGGRSVVMHMTAPESAGLFHRAVIQSGVGASSVVLPTLKESEKVGIEFAAAIGCPNQDAVCMRGVPIQHILANGEKPNLRAGNTVDGTSQLHQPGELIASGRFNKIPVINGSNRDEATWIVALFGELAGKAPLTANEYAARIGRLFGPDVSSRVLTEYPVTSFKSPSLALAAVMGDRDLICSQRRLTKELSRFVPIYAYEFGDQSAPTYYPSVSFPYLAGHTQEIQYLFKDFRGAKGEKKSLSPGQSELSRHMVSFWTNFARNAEPGGSGGVHWRRYSGETPEFLRLHTPALEHIPDDLFVRDHHCAFWDTVDGEQRR